MSDAPLKPPKFERPPFRLNGRSGLVALNYWLREIPDFSAFTLAEDCRGRPIIKLGHAHFTPCGKHRRWWGQDLIVCDSLALREQAVVLVRPAFAVSPRSARAA